MPSQEEIRAIEGRVYLDSAYDALLMASLSLTPINGPDTWNDKHKAINLATDLVAYALGKADPYDLTTVDVIAAYAAATKKGKENA